MKTLTLILASLALVVACASANDNPTVEQTIRTFAPSYCQKLASCYPDGFATAYPGGVPACVDRLLASAGAHKIEKSACTQEELNACKADVENSACASALDASALPTSCKKC